MLDNHLNRKPIAVLVAVTIALGTIVTTALHAQDERSSAAPKSDKKPGQENAKNRSTGQNLESLLNDVNETVELGSYLLRQLTPKPGEGLTPLMHAARGNNIKELETLIKKGANVNDTSRFGWTALMFAAWKGHEKAVEALLDAGADPDVVSKRITGNTQAPTPKTTALAQAIKNEHVPIAQTLLARGADADPISVALAGGLEDLALLKKLHSKGADLSLNSGVMYYPSAMILACQ
ncbi:MAG: ankyrin repeat domain-containing protein, partial [Methyloceanibacter sp.]